MSTIADDDRRVIAEVDTHEDFHVVGVLDEFGRRLDRATFPTTTLGYRDLTGWVTGFRRKGTAAGLCRQALRRMVGCTTA
jgi:hypothetical protein